MTQIHRLNFSSQQTALETLPGVAPVDVSAINDIFTLSFAKSGSFDGFLGAADYSFDISTGLQLNLNDSSLGSVQVDYPLLLGIDIPERITEGDSFQIAMDQTGLRVIDDGLSDETGQQAATITGESLNFDGLSIDLFFRSEESSLRDISLFNTSFGSAFEFEQDIVFPPIDVEVPLFELPSGSASIDPIDGISAEIGTPEGAEDSSTLEVALPGFFEDLDVQIIETLASVTVNPLALLANVPKFKPLEILNKTFEFPKIDILGSQVEAALETVLLAPFIQGGFGVVQDIKFMPLAPDVDVFLEGAQVDTGFLSTDFDLTAPALAGNDDLLDGTLDGELRFDLDGQLALEFKIAPVGTIGVEALGATGSVTVDGEESSVSIGPVFESAVTGATDIGSFNILAPITDNLPDDFFPEVVVPFSIAIDGAIPPNAQPQLLDGNDAPLIFSDPLTVIDETRSPLPLGQIKVVDLDTSSEILVRLKVSTGTLFAADNFNVTVSGSGTNLITLRGLQGDLSTFLSAGTAIQYQPNANGDPDGLEISTDDLTGNQTFVLASLEIRAEDPPAEVAELTTHTKQATNPTGETLLGESIDHDANDQTPNIDVADYLSGGSGNDTLGGDVTPATDDDKADVLLGNGGDDRISGGGGANFLSGGSGNDLLQAQAYTEANTFRGGSGNDTLQGAHSSFLGPTVQQRVLSSTAGSTYDGGSGNDSITGRGSLNGGTGNDTLIGVGTLRGGAGDDQITSIFDHASPESSLLDGGDGNDRLHGIGTLLGGEGNDTLTLDLLGAPGATGLLDGGEGNDRISGNGTLVGGGGNDSLTGSGDLSGGLGDDTLTGEGTLDGGEGDDVITGRDSTDTLIGGAGNDTITTGSGVLDVDDVQGGTGNDMVITTLRDGQRLDGGADEDELELYVGNAAETIINLKTGLTTNTTGLMADITGFEILKLRSESSLFITGTDVANRISVEDKQLTGQPGLSVQIAAGKGDDTIEVDADFATIQGEAGNDLIRSEQAETLEIDGGTGDDSIEATSGLNRLVGGAGKDSIQGGAEQDTVVGDLEDNFLHGGAGNNDLLDLTDASGTAPLFVDLTTATQMLTFGTSGITIGGFENVVGRQTGNDVLVTTGTARGLGGDDVIAKAVTADGGAGNDTYLYDGATTRGNLNIDLSNAGDQDLGTPGKLSGFENVSTGGGNDTIRGSDAPNLLNGGGGNDQFLALTHLDKVIGGAGFDTADFSASRFGLQVDLADGAVTFESGVTGLASGLEALIGSDAGHDNVTSQAVSSRLEGRGGDDTLTSFGGNDTLRGDDGSDVINTGGGDDDVAAGDDDDQVDLGAGNDTADLGDGNDYAVTGDGRDTVQGGKGNDTIVAAGNSADPNAPIDDVLSGGDDDDFIIGGAGDDILNGDAGNDTLDAGSGFDTVTGGAGSNTFVLAANGGNDFTDFDGSKDFLFVEGVAFDQMVIVEDFLGFAEIRLPSGKRIFTKSLMVDLTPDRLLTRKPEIPAANQAPTDIQLDRTVVDENSVKGTVIGTFSVTDPNMGDTHSYQLLNDAGGIFALDDGRLIVQGALDFEQAPSHAITLRVTDGGGLSFDKPFTILVNDLAEVSPAPPAPPATQTSGDGGNNRFSPGPGIETFTLGAGEDTLSGNIGDFFGDRITDFSTEDTLIFNNQAVPRSNIQVQRGSAILIIDSNGDGIEDGRFTLEGDFSGGDFMAVTTGGSTRITYETFLPGLFEGVQVNASQINGINNQAFLTGDGSTGYRVTLEAAKMGAAMDNALGVYEIDAAGRIVDVRILASNVKTGAGGSFEITGVESGNTLGFFIVQDGAGAAATWSEADTFVFTDGPNGAAATTASGTDTRLNVNGVDVGLEVFHSFSASLNSDGASHTLSGVNPGGQSITIGFEDLIGGDNDFQDVVFSVASYDIV
jgi:Ca2+-binding RTX toxin-like protein